MAGGGGWRDQCETGRPSVSPARYSSDRFVVETRIHGELEELARFDIAERKIARTDRIETSGRGEAMKRERHRSPAQEKTRPGAAAAIDEFGEGLERARAFDRVNVVED